METTWRAIIIDDEKLAREIIKQYLQNHPEISVIAECENGFEGIKVIQEQKPDLVFLDIQMPKIDGFEMLELIEEKPIILFTTAYDEFALKAFEHNALDYLLKPFSEERFNKAIAKILQSNKTGNAIPIDVNKSQKLQRILIKNESQILVVPCENVLYIESQDDYVMLYTPTGKYLKKKTMKYFEDNLESTLFIRIHRSYIVNISQIIKIELYEKDSYQVTLKRGATLKTSKSGYAQLKKMI